MTDPVAEPTVEYLQMAQFWFLTGALRGGTHEMRQAGTTFLPQEPDEAAAAYENRLKRSVLTNLYRKTADKLIGKPLKKPIIINDDVPAQIKVLLDDIDSLGTRLDVFAKNIFQQAVDDGLTHILVEFPNTEAQEDGEFIDPATKKRFLSVAQAQERNIRPFGRHVRAADLIGWKFEKINGEKVLTQIRIAEIAKVDGDDEFTQHERERIRVVERDRWRLYEKLDSPVKDTNGKTTKEWELIQEGPITLGMIPLVTLYTNQTGFMKARPWLEDIAHLNVAHWQSDSDQRNLLHIARIPILFAKGFGSDDTEFSISIGSNSFVKAPSSADLKYVEHTGAGITAGRDDLKDIEDRIQMLGMETMMKRPGGSTTATQSAIESADANSSLGMVSQELENTLEGMLDLFSLWMELGDSGGSLDVFKDFGIEVADVADIDMLIKARMAGEISQITFLKELKRRSLLADDFDPQTEIDLLDIEGAGTATTDEPDDPLAMAEAGETPEPKHKGRNNEGDITSLVDGHRHVLEANGKTSTEQDEEGVSHAHTWNEFAIQTSVDDGHSHVLLERTAATKADAPVIPPPDPGNKDEASPSQPGNSPPAGDSKDKTAV